MSSSWNNNFYEPIYNDNSLHFRRCYDIRGTYGDQTNRTAATQTPESSTIDWGFNIAQKASSNYMFGRYMTMLVKYKINNVYHLELKEYKNKSGFMDKISMTYNPMSPQARGFSFRPAYSYFYQIPSELPNVTNPTTDFQAFLPYSAEGSILNHCYHTVLLDIQKINDVDQHTQAVSLSQFETNYNDGTWSIIRVWVRTYCDRTQLNVDPFMLYFVGESPIMWETWDAVYTRSWYGRMIIPSYNLSQMYATPVSITSYSAATYGETGTISEAGYMTLPIGATTQYWCCNANRSQKSWYWGLSYDQVIQMLDANLWLPYSKTNALYDGINIDDPDRVYPIINMKSSTMTGEHVPGDEAREYIENNPGSSLDLFINALTEFVNTLLDKLKQDEAEETDEMETEDPLVTAGGYFHQMYSLTPASLQQFSDWLWSDGDRIRMICDSIYRLFDNVMDSIISIRQYPFDIISILSGHYTNMYVGLVNSEITAYKITDPFVKTINLGGVRYVPKFNDFRDYRPYTSVYLYIPFCGIYELDPAVIMNRYVKIEMTIDFFSGSCTARVWIDDVLYMYADGMIGIEVPVSAPNATEFARTVLNATLSAAAPAIGTAVNVAGSMLNESTDAAVSQIKNSDPIHPERLYLRKNIDAVKTIAGNVATAAGIGAATAGYIVGAGLFSAATTGIGITKSTSSPATALGQPLYPYFLIQEAVTSWSHNPTEKENWGYTHGYLCNLFMALSSFAAGSFVKCSGIINTTGLKDMTQTEKDMIHEFLRTGVRI